MVDRCLCDDEEHMGYYTLNRWDNVVHSYTSCLGSINLTIVYKSLFVVLFLLLELLIYFLQRDKLNYQCMYLAVLKIFANSDNFITTQKLLLKKSKREFITSL